MKKRESKNKQSSTVVKTFANIPVCVTCFHKTHMPGGTITFVPRHRGGVKYAGDIQIQNIPTNHGMEKNAGFFLATAIDSSRRAARLRLPCCGLLPRDGNRFFETCFN